MGDRANIVIEQDTDMFPHPVFLYTHWRGSEIKETLKSALKKGKERWGDAQYLSRVIFCELVGNDDGITGYGITTRIGDSGHNLLCVNMKDQTVNERDSSEDLAAPVIKSWTFAEYLDASFEVDDPDDDLGELDPSAACKLGDETCESCQ